MLRKLVVVAFPCRWEGWFPEIRAAFEETGRASFEQMRQAPLYRAWLEVAPDPEAFPGLMDKMGALLRSPHGWTDEIGTLVAQTMLVFADADSIPVSHAAEFFALLGGGLRDAGWDGSARSGSRLAVLPGRSHYDLFDAPEIAELLGGFLS